MTHTWRTFLVFAVFGRIRILLVDRVLAADPVVFALHLQFSTLAGLVQLALGFALSRALRLVKTTRPVCSILLVGPLTIRPLGNRSICHGSPLVSCVSVSWR